jgi:hypothetical protein
MVASCSMQQQQYHIHPSNRSKPGRQFRIYVTTAFGAIVSLGLFSVHLYLLWRIQKQKPHVALAPQGPLLDSSVSTVAAARELQHKNLSSTGFLGMELARETSSVDYHACCGLGHRLSKLSDAKYLATKLGFALRSFWGYCDAIEVFDYLFGPQPINEIQNLTNWSHYLRINNEVPGFTKLVRLGTLPNRSDVAVNTCPCSMEKATSDVDFYQSLRQRFRLQSRVDDFRITNHWMHPDIIVVGIHIRAGNGEEGDFANRGRQISHLQSWIRNLASLLLDIFKETRRNIVLFIASDTSSIVSDLALLMPNNVTVLTNTQTLPDDGVGVWFGERGQVLRRGEKCKQAWENSMIDMILLSYADIVVAGRPSSFVQSMPLTLSLAQPFAVRKASRPYCEVDGKAANYRCYATFEEWCCKGQTSFSLGEIQKYDYLRVPTSDLSAAQIHIKERPRKNCAPKPQGWKQVCLPYDWKHPG